MFAVDIITCHSVPFSITTSFVGQTAAKVDTRGVAFKTALALAVVTNFERQYNFYNTAFKQEAAAESKEKLPVRPSQVRPRRPGRAGVEPGRQH